MYSLDSALTYGKGVWSSLGDLSSLSLSLIIALVMVFFIQRIYKLSYGFSLFIFLFLYAYLYTVLKRRNSSIV